MFTIHYPHFTFLHLRKETIIYIPKPMSKEVENHARRAEETVKKQREIQNNIRKLDKTKQQSEKRASAQTGPENQPMPPQPEQELDKPGIEDDLVLQPKYMAPDYKGSQKLKGKVAIITGGDSGIGRSVAILFAREGADVAIVYLNEHKDAEKTKQIVEEEGQQALLCPGDVTDYGFCKYVVQQVIDEFGKINILVNNAAFQEHAKDLESISEEHFDMTLKTNLYGYFYMTKAVLPHLNERDSIVNTSSVNGWLGNKMLMDYSMTKGGINAFTKSLAKNLVNKGIRVNAVAPGPVWTPLNPADRPDKEIKKFGSDSPMKRPAQPEELSPTYVHLAAPSCSSYITGQIIGVIGGVTSKS